MPRPARRFKSRRSSNYEHVREHLLTGTCLPCLIHLPDCCTEAELRETWEREGDQLTREWARERPGTRPWAWWTYTAPGRRERTDGGIHPHDNKQRSLHVAASENKEFWKKAYSLFWGLPGAHIMPFDHGLKASSFECEWEYLVRNGLLLPEDSP